MVAETLHHAHSRSVVHRDVKPENIVMSYSTEKGQWHPYLTDFDLAWFSTASLLSKEALGTWQYSAPEQYTAPGSPSARAPSTDAYSFGQLCFYAVTGSDPIGLDLANNRLALEKHVRGGWSADAAEEFIQLYSESTSRDPGKRPDFNAIRERLFRISELLRDLHPTKRLAPEKFLRELVFSFAGLSADSRISDNSFLTLSLMTRITVTTVRERHDTIDCLFDIEAQAEPLVGGAKNFEQVRRILLGRIEAALGEFKGSHKHHGPTAPFGIGIMLQDVPLRLEGISLSRQLITRIADIIEGK